MHVILDIDGTLSDPTHREHFLKESPQNWDGFFDPAAVLADPPIKEAQRVVSRMQELHYHITFLTARGEALRDTTTRWLLEHFNVAVDDFSLLMRPANGMMPAAEFKAQAMQQLLAEFKAAGANDFLFVEDNLQNCARFEAEGVVLKAPQCWSLMFPSTAKEAADV